MPELSQGRVPLTETTFYILLSMATERKHGYAMLKDVEEMSQGRVASSTGTLYGALSRLLDQGLIERVEEEDPAEVGRARKFYELTHIGHKALHAEMERLRALMTTAQRRLAEPGI